MLPELHSSEATAAEKSKALQVLPHDLASGRTTSGWTPCSLLAGPALLVTSNDVLQGTQKHVERVTVQHKALGSLRNDHHGGTSDIVLQQGLLSEVLRFASRSDGLELLHSLAVNDNVDLPLVHDIESVSRLALLDYQLPFGEVHLHKSFRKVMLLHVEERVKDWHGIQVLDILLELVVGHLHEDVLEVATVNDPNHAVHLGLDGSSARHEVQ
mmetsp:Transcript_68050/g.120121  ORF Transcript_68050/g.120121 Transcript_68050/m.120121 type:complete len:213 (+) Transcript_68050:982-1620(+)